MRRRATAALALTLAALTGGGVAAASTIWHTDPIPGSETVTSGAVIRFSDPDGSPSFHANAAHVAAGVRDVRVDPASGWLEVTQTMTDATQNPVVTAQCQTDETLAGRGLICGATGGTDRTRFVIYDTRIDRPLDLRDADDLMRVQGRNANLWVQWTHWPGGWGR